MTLARRDHSLNKGRPQGIARAEASTVPTMDGLPRLFRVIVGAIPCGRLASLRRMKSSPLSPIPTETPRLKRGSVLLMLLVGLLLFSLGACSAGTSPTNVGPQATVPATQLPAPTPTSLPAGIVLYQADWSHGLSGWPETQGWKVMQGLLENDASSPSSTLTIPYRPPVSNYAIEIRLQMVQLLSQIGGSSFAIFAMKAPGKDGYEAGVNNILGTAPHPMAAHPASQVLLDPSGDTVPGSGMPLAYYPRSGWHTYRVEVRGNGARLLVDGIQVGDSAMSEQAKVLSNGPLGLSCQEIILSVSSVRILSL
jgi:hypothetical protein